MAKCQNNAPNYIPFNGIEPGNFSLLEILKHKSVWTKSAITRDKATLKSYKKT